MAILAFAGLTDDDASSIGLPRWGPPRRAGQHLNQRTLRARCCLLAPKTGYHSLREDVGRHNVLDKLTGTQARVHVNAADGVLLLSSRVSVELVQKAAMIGAPTVVAVSAPTALVHRVAEAAGITLIGIARDDEFEVFTHPSRITPKRCSTSSEKLANLANETGRFVAHQVVASTAGHARKPMHVFVTCSRASARRNPTLARSG